MNGANALRKNYKFIIALPILIAAVVFIISLLQTPLYKSSVSLLIVQKQTQDIDATAAVQSAEQMADILTRVVETESFRSSVLSQDNLNLDLSSRPWERAREWNKIVRAKNITDTGILIVDVYQPTTSQATKLASSVQKVLNERGYDYLGVTSENVVIRQLNPPAPTSGQPATPNLLLNVIVGLILGILIAVSLVLLFPNHRFSRYVPSFGGNNSDGGGKQNYTQSGVFYSPKLEQEITDSSNDHGNGDDYDHDRNGRTGEPPLNLPTAPEDQKTANFIARANRHFNRTIDQ